MTTLQYPSVRSNAPRFQMVAVRTPYEAQIENASREEIEGAIAEICHEAYQNGFYDKSFRFSIEDNKLVLDAERPLTDEEKETAELEERLEKADENEKRRIYEKLRGEFGDKVSGDEFVVAEEEITGDKVYPDPSNNPTPYSVLALEEVRGDLVFAKGANRKVYVLEKDSVSIDRDTTKLEELAEKLADMFNIKSEDVDETVFGVGSYVEVQSGHHFFEGDNYSGVIVTDMGDDVYEVAVNVFGKLETAVLPKSMMKELTEDEFLSKV